MAETPATTFGASAWSRSRAALEPLTAAAKYAYDRPRAVLAGLIAAQWVGVLAFALTVRHNGWVFYQGGDQIWYTTTAWLLGDGLLPPTNVGFGWVLPLVPLGWFVGPEYTAFLPPVLALNVLVLGPVALACVYAIACRIGGRLLGFYASIAWVVAPYLSIPFFRDDYHDRYVEQFLPQALGLTALADYPSMVCLLVAAYFLVRAYESSDWTWALLAGLAAGAGATIKPANLIFLAGPALLLLLSRHWRNAVTLGAATVPSLLLLALWKQRGLGSVPVFAVEETRLAVGSLVSPTALDRYLPLDWDVFRSNMASLREYAYSARVLQWIPFAGAFAVSRRSLPLGGLLAGWFGAFLVVKGAAPQATVDSGSFFRLLMPAYPAYLLLFAALPLLVPGALRKVRAGVLPRPQRGVGRRTLIIGGVLSVAVPLVAVAAPQQLQADDPEAITINTILTPVDGAIRVTVTPDGARRTLTWTHPDFGSTKVFYRVYRTRIGGTGLTCTTTRSPECALTMLELTSTREARYVDLSPPENAQYRVGIGTNWQDDPTGGDVVLISPRIAATP